MRRTTLAILAAVALVAVIVAPVGAKEFGQLYAKGEVFRTFGTPANVPAGTGTDPIYTFENSTNPDQLSVARFAPGPGSHGGRWAVSHVTWVDPADSGILVTSAEELDGYVSEGRLTVQRDPAADFRCPILPARGSGS
jgi:hypothetical protein